MMQFLLAITGCLCLVLLAILRRPKGRWPQEGHGHTYFTRPTSNNW
ncbi:MAG TPA: hypothetical protein VHY19_05455 [Steroidobacteraceae bacterium]|jgi:hypothetical protein|nr:hypothetical protein [Steroidobacteraceae bacterium]